MPGVGAIEGRLYFTGGGVEGAPVEVRRYKDGEAGDLVAETTSGADGSWQIEGNLEAGDYLVTAALGGLAWIDPVSGRQGRYETDDVLRSVVLGFERIDKRYVSVTPFTTLAIAAGQSRQLAGTPFGVADAVTAMWTHLTLNPAETRILDERGGALTAAVSHALLIDTFTALAARLSEQAGLEPGTEITAASLLSALLEDAAGASPPGVYDGVGAAGVVQLAGTGYTLDGQTLRAEFAAALGALTEDEQGPWSGFNLTATAKLRRSILCSTSALFPVCEEAPIDETAPVFGEVEPVDGSALQGMVSLTIAVTDPESPVDGVSVRPAIGGDPLLLERRDGLDKWVFTFDSTRFGGDRLELEVEATSEGGAATAQLSYALQNLGSGTLAGVVVGGRNVRVRAEGVHPGGLEPLGDVLADADGQFTLQISEWEGPVLLTASGASGEQSQYYDRAREAWLTWRTRDSIATMVPRFDPAEANSPRVVVSALGDLAFARAQQQAAAGGGALVTEYAEALLLLGEHFNVPDGGDSLWRLRPTLGNAFGRPLDDSDYLALGEACLHQQALRLATVLYPGTEVNFTALNLVEVWRDDVAADGMLDGRLGVTPATIQGEGGRSEVLPDGFRGNLAVACTEWLRGPASPEELTTREVIGWLQEMAVRASALFNVDVFPAPDGYDVTGPELVVAIVSAEPSLQSVEAGPDAWTVGGQVQITVTATDMDAGAEQIELVFLDGVQRLELSDESLRIELDGIAEALSDKVIWKAVLDSTVLADGEILVQIGATDTIANRTERRVTLTVDNTAPAVVLTPAAPAVEDGEIWRTNGEGLTFGVVADDLHLASVDLVFGNQRLAFETLDAVEAALPMDDGLIPLVVTATDTIGNQQVQRREVVVDRTAPNIGVAVALTDPTLTAAELDSDRWVVAGELVLTLTVSDALSGVSRVEAFDAQGVAYVVEESPVDVARPVEEEDGPLSKQIVLDTGALADGQVIIRVVAVDGAGNERVRQIAFEIDNTAPTVELAPALPAVDFSPSWYTSAERLEFTIGVEEAYPEAVTLDFVATAAVVAPNDEPIAVPLPVADGAYPLTVTARDLVGHETVVSRSVVVDRLAPTVTITPQAFVDESQYVAVREGDEVFVRLPANPLRAPFVAGATLRKLQTTWDQNLPRLQLERVGDDPAEVAISVTVNGRPMAVEGEGPVHELVIDAAILDIDPLNAPPAAGFEVSVQVTARDRAGNTQEGQFEFTLDVQPPPILIERVQALLPPSNAVESLSFEDETIAALFGDGPPEVELARYRVTNPSAVSVFVRLNPGEVSVEADTTVKLSGGFVINLSEELGDALVVEPSCIKPFDLRGGPRVPAYNKFGVDMDVDGTNGGYRVSGGFCEALVPVDFETQSLREVGAFGRFVWDSTREVGARSGLDFQLMLYQRPAAPEIANTVSFSPNLRERYTGPEVQSNSGHWFYRRIGRCLQTPDAFGCLADGLYLSNREATLARVSVGAMEPWPVETFSVCGDAACPGVLSIRSLAPGVAGVEVFR